MYQQQSEIMIKTNKLSKNFSKMVSISKLKKLYYTNVFFQKGLQRNTKIIVLNLSLIYFQEEGYILTHWGSLVVYHGQCWWHVFVSYIQMLIHLLLYKNSLWFIQRGKLDKL
jgi:hypothetical protein